MIHADGARFEIDWGAERRASGRRGRAAAFMQEPRKSQEARVMRRREGIQIRVRWGSTEYGDEF